MKISAKKLLFFLLITTSCLFLSARVFALQVGWPPTPSGTFLTDDSDITLFIRYFYEWSIILGTLATFFTMVFGGFTYLTSAGDPGKMKGARENIYNSFLGLILLLSAFLILNTINPDLTKLETPVLDPFDFDLSFTEDPASNPVSKCTKVMLFQEEDCGGRCGDPCDQGVGAELGVNGYYFVSGSNWRPLSADRYKLADCSLDGGLISIIEDGGLCVLHLYHDYNTDVLGNPTSCAGSSEGEHEAVFLPQKNLQDFFGDSSQGDDPDGLELNWNEIKCLRVSSSVRN